MSGRPNQTKVNWNCSTQCSLTVVLLSPTHHLLYFSPTLSATCSSPATALAYYTPPLPHHLPYPPTHPLLTRSSPTVPHTCSSPHSPTAPHLLCCSCPITSPQSKLAIHLLFTDALVLAYPACFACPPAYLPGLPRIRGKGSRPSLNREHVGAR